MRSTVSSSAPSSLAAALGVIGSTHTLLTQLSPQ